MLKRVEDLSVSQQIEVFKIQLEYNQVFRKRQDFARQGRKRIVEVYDLLLRTISYRRYRLLREPIKLTIED